MVIRTGSHDHNVSNCHATDKNRTGMIKHGHLHTAEEKINNNNKIGMRPQPNGNNRNSHSS